MATKTINPNKIKVRDLLMVRLINGATKAAVHTNHKREHSRKACRGRSWHKEHA